MVGLAAGVTIVCFIGIYCVMAALPLLAGIFILSWLLRVAF